MFYEFSNKCQHHEEKNKDLQLADLDFYFNPTKIAFLF
jgi:hypothetical protein